MAVIGSLLMFGAVLGGLLYFHMVLDRTREFREQAMHGQRIVRAIEKYKQQTGNYPMSLDDLLPEYLREVPDGIQDLNGKIGGWEYRTITNATYTFRFYTYTLRFYMGRGGVEYEPPNWIGNNEGNRKVILTNEEPLPSPNHKAIVTCYYDKHDHHGSSTASYADDGHTYTQAGIDITFPKAIEIRWYFLKHKGNADVYEFTRRFTVSGQDNRTEHKIVEFSGERIVVFRGRGQMVVMQSPKFQGAEEESDDTATIGRIVKGLADELPKMVGKSTEELKRDHGTILSTLARVAQNDLPAPQPWYVWNYSRPNGTTNYVVFYAKHIFEFPGESSASIVLVSSTGTELGRWSFSTGWRIESKSAALAYDEVLGAPVITVGSVALINGRDVAKQYFALVDDKLYFIRMEDSQGRLLRNNYLSPNHTLGGNLPAKTLPDWTALLESEQLPLRLAALTYLSGVHMNPDNPRLEILSENMHYAKVAKEFIAATTTKARITAYRHSPIPWLAEAADLAATPPDAALGH